RQVDANRSYRLVIDTEQFRDVVIAPVRHQLERIGNGVALAIACQVTALQVRRDDVGDGINVAQHKHAERIAAGRNIVVRNAYVPTKIAQSVATHIQPDTDTFHAVETVDSVEHLVGEERDRLP